MTSGSSPGTKAKWVKAAMDRMDTLPEEITRIEGISQMARLGEQMFLVKVGSGLGRCGFPPGPALEEYVH